MSGRGLCVELIIRTQGLPEVVCCECNREASIMRPWPTVGSCALKMIRSSNKGCFPHHSSVSVVNFAKVMYVTAKGRKFFTLVGTGLGKRYRFCQLAR
jgi:hypothetical protein